MSPPTIASASADRLEHIVGLPPVVLHRYDGGLRPPKPRQLEEDGEPMPLDPSFFRASLALALRF